MALLSIGVISYNTKELLETCLESILNNFPQFATEIIVIDNHSSDGSADMVKNRFPKVKLVVNSSNKGYAIAVNQFLNMSKGQTLLILNADVIILDHAIERTYEFYQLQENVGFIGCKILNDDGTLQKSCRGFPNLMNFLSENFYLYKLFPNIPLFGQVFMTHFNYNSIEKVQVILGAFMMVNKKVIDKIGPMDDRFFMYSEETDWCYRAVKAGFENMFYPDAKIIHLGEQSTRQSSVEMFIELHKSHHKYVDKHYNKLYLLIVKTVLVAGLILRLTLSFLAYIFSGSNIHFNKLKRYGMTLLWYFHLKR